MFSRSEIKYLAGAGAYDQGVGLYSMDKVTQFIVDKDGDYDDMTALVKESDREAYEVSISMNVTDDIMEFISCECREFDCYGGICKHCVAVLLEYNDYVNRRNAMERSAEKRESSLEKLKGIQKGISMKTTPDISALLQKKAMARSLPLIQGSTYGKVRMEPYAYFDDEGVKVEFKIGISKMYIMKDVSAFARALKEQENYKYGKNLQFVHTVDSFCEESRPLVKFVKKWGFENETSYGEVSYYGYFGDAAKSRYMELSPGYLEEFMQIMKGRIIYGSVQGDRIEKWILTEEKLHRELMITGIDQGIELTVKRIWGCMGKEHAFYFHDGKIYMESQEELAPVEDFQNCMNAVRAKKVFIENSDIPAFCKELLPVLEQFYECRKVNFDPSEYVPEPPKFKIYLDAPQENMIICKPSVFYGKKEYSIYTTEDIAARDMVKEAVLRKLLHEYGNAYDPMTKSVVAANDEERIYDLLTEGIPRMQEIAEVYISAALKRMEVQTAPKITVGISLEGNLLELTMTAGDMKKEELIEILSRYNPKKKYYRLKNGTFVNAEGSGLDTVAELRQGLQLTDKQMKQEQIRVQKYRAIYLDEELEANPVILAMKNKSFRSLVRNMKTIEDNDFEVPKSLEGVLREYQKKGFLWIKTLKFNGFGGILADDMGLGKTLQVIAFLLSEYLEREEGDGGVDSLAERNAIIIAPASLVYNWNSEFERFAPGMKVRMVIGTAAERKRILRESGEEEVLLTSYDLLKRDIEFYKPYHFRCQVIDEAQYIKNHNTQASKAVKVIQADFKLALTGTPVENRLSELWSIFDYLMPGFLHSYPKFREELETPIVLNQDEDAAVRLQKMIRPFVLRRLKKDVLKDLPDKLEENMYAMIQGEQQKLYDAHVKRMQLMLDKQSDEEFKSSKIQILSEITRLRQLCCDPSLVYEDYRGGSAKADLCMNMIHNAVEGGHKILLFSQFTAMLEHLERRMEEEEISFYTLTGETGKKKRAELVEAFNRDDTSVFCISLKAGGTGLNLTGADIVIHYDPWWNLAVQNQATDRAHRIGQKNIVNVYKLIAKGTIEENILKLQEKKRELADQILSGDAMSMGSFSRKELLELLERKK